MNEVNDSRVILSTITPTLRADALRSAREVLLVKAGKFAERDLNPDDLVAVAEYILCGFYLRRDLDGEALAPDAGVEDRLYPGCPICGDATSVEEAEQMPAAARAQSLAQAVAEVDGRGTE